MSNKLKKIFTNWKVIILLVFLLFAIVAISPQIDVSGVAIRSVTTNSSASLAGIESPKPTARPTSREVITAINNKIVDDMDDFYELTSNLEANRTVVVKTNKASYRLTTKPILQITTLPELEEKIIQEEREVNQTINGTITLVTETFNKTVMVNKTLTEVIGTADLGLSVYSAPNTNIKKGLDIQGGTRVLLQPVEKVSDADMDLLLENMKYRINVYGLSDIVVRKVDDLSGTPYVLVEVAGVNEEEVKDLLSKQGKFEAKIGNETVFMGGRDITYVARSADQSGIDPNYGCSQVASNQWSCRFRFAITLSPEAAEKQAGVTGKLEIITEENGNQYLSEQLSLYLDDAQVDALNIAADLKGSATTDIAISGPGVGTTRDEAVFDALQNMKELQTVLVTGSLPVKMNIVKTDNISPVLGEAFLKNAVKVGLLAMLGVLAVIFIRFRKWQIVVPMMFTMLSEVALLMGLASLISWNLDLAAIAGVIIAVGTGVDAAIVISDEILHKEKTTITSWKERVRRAFFIIMAAYFTTVVAMIPLYKAGAGLLKGFAIITIFGITFGVFITRPAFAAIIEILLKE